MPDAAAPPGSVEPLTVRPKVVLVIVGGCTVMLGAVGGTLSKNTGLAGETEVLTFPAAS